MTTRATDQARTELLGAWRLTTWHAVGDDGITRYPLGENAIGRLVYDMSGGVSAQLVRVNQPPFASNVWPNASVEEMCAAWASYFGYFGTFMVDAGAATVSHHVDAGSFPNMVGTDQVHHYRLEAGRLVLSSDTPLGQVRMVWEK